ncbi:MAG: hypothetical protein MAG453_01817 [Calditrichaeota bacterium]|nr:hypothetical protein [Calditrichota bacterium]
MLPRPFTAIALLAAAAVFVSCAGRRPALEGVVPSPDALENHLKSQWRGFVRYESKLTLRVRSGDYSAALFGRCRLEPPGRLALSLNAPFGIPVGEIVLNDGVYEAAFGDGSFERDSLSSLDLTEWVGFPVSPEDLPRLFEPLARPAESAGVAPATVSFEVTADSDSLWRWRLAGAGFEREILFNPARGVVVSERWLNPITGELVLEKQYRSVDMFGNLPLARELRVRGGGDSSLLVRFDHVELNPEWTSDPFRLRSSGA